jgi:thiamin pyrophosphokinase catalytic domain protein
MLTDEGYFLLITEPSTIDVLIGQQISIFNFQRTPISLGGVRWPLVETTLPALWCGSLNCAIENQITVHTTSPILIYLANV